MLTKIRERTQDALLREEFLCGEANFRTLAEAIVCVIFISQGKRLSSGWLPAGQPERFSKVMDTVG